MKLPIILKLRKETHREVARAQDLIVEELFRVVDDAVLHGGTAIWRCFGGNRFSEDVDAYLPRDETKLELLFDALAKRGFTIERKKLTENSLYSTLNLNGTVVRFEALFRKADGRLTEYETAEGGILMVYALDAGTIIREKVGAYLTRWKVRDLYDIFFLLRRVDDKTGLKRDLTRLVNNFRKPDDEEELKVLILEGLTPAVDKMLQYIRSFV